MGPPNQDLPAFQASSAEVLKESEEAWTKECWAASNSQPFSHIHQPGIAVGGHCIPVYPRLYLWNDPDATVVRAARAANAEMPDYTIGLLEGAYGDLTGARVVVLGAAYRGGVKATAFSGVFDAVEAINGCGGMAVVHDPMYSDGELAKLGFQPYHLGEPADAAVVQADHAQYRDLAPADLPGIKAFIDGRRVSSAEKWDGIIYRVIGKT